MFGWLRRRRAREEAAVLAALFTYEPPMSSVIPLATDTGIGMARTYVVLARLEAQGRVMSQWSSVSAPRRRLYRAVKW